MMNIAVLTPDRQIFQGPINSVKVPGALGEFQILKNHAPIVSSLGAGQVEIVTGDGVYSYYDEVTGGPQTSSRAGEKLVYQIESGFIEVLNNEVSLLIQGVTKQ